MPAISTSRIQARFKELRERGAKGLVAYVTGGDPSLEDMPKILAALDRGGADVIELGVPFSDPLADGPVIQRASERALRGGATLKKILGRLPVWRAAVRPPIILFSYYNPILQYGLDRFAFDAARGGADGALVVDLTPEESEPYVRTMRAHQLDTVFLASPTSPDERLRLVGELSTGFLYLISRAGTTGERDKVMSGLPTLVARARQFTSVPIAVGFGVSNPAQVREVQAVADAAVVGSALVHAIEERYSTRGAAGVEEFVRWLKT